MEDTKQETDFEDLQWLHDGLMAKVNEKLDKYSNLSADMMSKKCHDLMQELEKMHKLHVDSLTRFQNNQPEHKVHAFLLEYHLTYVFLATHNINII